MNTKKKLLFTAVYIALVLVVIKLAQTFVQPMFANGFVGSLAVQILFTVLAVIGAVIQAVMVIPVGIVLGAIYFRGCNNLLPVVLIHALVDAVSFIASGALSGTTLTDAISGASINGGPLAKVGTLLVYTLLSLFLMRRSKMEKAIAARRAA